MVFEKLNPKILLSGWVLKNEMKNSNGQGTFENLNRKEGGIKNGTKTWTNDQ